MDEQSVLDYLNPKVIVVNGQTYDVQSLLLKRSRIVTIELGDAAALKKFDRKKNMYDLPQRQTNSGRKPIFNNIEQAAQVAIMTIKEVMATWPEKDREQADAYRRAAIRCLRRQGMLHLMDAKRR